jgi:hypothetical protein
MGMPKRNLKRILENSFVERKIDLNRRKKSNNFYINQIVRRKIIVNDNG